MSVSLNGVSRGCKTSIQPIRTNEAWSYPSQSSSQWCNVVKRTNFSKLAWSRIYITFKPFLFSTALSSLVLLPPFFYSCQNWQIFLLKPQLPRPRIYRLCCFDSFLHRGKSVCVSVCVCFVSTAACETDTRYSEHELASLLPARTKRTGAARDDTSKARCDVEPSAASSV